MVQKSFEDRVARLQADPSHDSGRPAAGPHGLQNSSEPFKGSLALPPAYKKQIRRNRGAREENSGLKPLRAQHITIGDTDHADMTLNHSKRSREQPIQPLWPDQADHLHHATRPAHLPFAAPWSREGQVSRAGGMVQVVCLIRPERLDGLLTAAFAVVERHIGVVSVTDCDVLRAERF